jgi:thiamine-phosphate pyrophosphorylase
MPPLTFRLLDANLNRASEGLRVLEDIARFILDDRTLSRDCKAARHILARVAMPYDATLLTERDSAGDTGREAPTAAGGNPRELVAVVRANAKRVEESLRVIEEFARGGAGGVSIDAVEIERLRYSTYELEKAIAARLLRTEAASRVRGLYAVVDRQFCRGRAPVDVAREAIAGGARVIQLRDKVNERRAVYRDAVELNELCGRHGALFVVNDHVDAAAAVGAPAVHVGQEDLPVDAVRRVVPMATIVGVSCASVDEVRRALDDGADYIAVGAVFPTTQKAEAAVVGLDLLRQARRLVGDVPLVAIGGINLANVAAVIDAGADAVAVIGAVAGRPDVAIAAREMSDAIEERRKANG